MTAFHAVIRFLFGIVAVVVYCVASFIQLHSSGTSVFFNCSKLICAVEKARRLNNCKQSVCARVYVRVRC